MGQHGTVLHEIFTFFQYNSGFLSGSISSKLSLFISIRSSGSHNQSGYSSLAFSFGSDKKSSLSSSLILKISAAFSLQTFKPQQNSWSFFVSWILDQFKSLKLAEFREIKKLAFLSLEEKSQKSWISGF